MSTLEIIKGVLLRYLRKHLRKGFFFLKPVSFVVYICVRQWDKQRKAKMAGNSLRKEGLLRRNHIWPN